MAMSELGRIRVAVDRDRIKDFLSLFKGELDRTSSGSDRDRPIKTGSIAHMVVGFAGLDRFHQRFSVHVFKHQHLTVARVGGYHREKSIRVEFRRELACLAPRPLRQSRHAFFNLLNEASTGKHGTGVRGLDIVMYHMQVDCKNGLERLDPQRSRLRFLVSVLISSQ